MNFKLPFTPEQASAGATEVDNLTLFLVGGGLLGAALLFRPQPPPVAPAPIPPGPIVQFPPTPTPPAPPVEPTPPHPATRQPLIQIALLLDNSGSMSGLLEQAKSQLWHLVNQLAEAKKG